MSTPNQAGRAQLKHALLDASLPDHAKVKPLKRLFGAGAKCSIYEFYMAMSKATNAIVSHHLLVTIATDNDVEDVDGFIAHCIDEGLIHAEGGGFSNGPVIKDQESYYRKLNKDRIRKHSEAPPPGILPPAERERPDPDTDSDNDIDPNLKKEGAAQPELVPDSKFAPFAEAALVKRDDPGLQKDNQFINCGRRPLKKFPLIKLTPKAFCDVLESYEASGVPVDSRGIHLRAFQKVQSKLETKRGKGESLDGVDCFSWLIGFAKKELLDELRSETDLERSNVNLTRARK